MILFLHRICTRLCVVVFLGSGVLLLTDSIGKHVSGVDGLEVLALLRYTITKMTGECERSI